MLVSMDECVEALALQLKDFELCKPQVLILMATGTQHLIEHLSDARETQLAELDGVPANWQAATLHSGCLGELKLWALDDIGADPSPPARDHAPAWHSALPVWLAAHAGAEICVHTSAGSSLDPASPSGFAVLRDHINLSGQSPLTGLGESQLGPLFPDLSNLQHLGLRHAALARAAALDLSVTEAIAACTSGPALETRAERQMLARLGADVSVQSLAAPLIACAHAGMACLALVATSAEPQDGIDLELLVQQAAHAGPALNQWLLALAPDLKQAADVLNAKLLT
jgi:purine-nucleoside phosphorylase